VCLAAWRTVASQQAATACALGGRPDVDRGGTEGEAGRGGAARSGRRLGGTEGEAGRGGAARSGRRAQHWSMAARVRRSRGFAARRMPDRRGWVGLGAWVLGRCGSRTLIPDDIYSDQPYVVKFLDF
jgi:hypothetical protein